MRGQFDFPEDAERLPEGFKRIAYDSDTTRFTFRDSDGHLYQGEAGAEYGILNPKAASTTSLSRTRPNAFASESSSSIPTPSKQKSTFQDILPPDLITTSSLSEKKPESPVKGGSPTVPRQKLVKAVRKSVLPKMQGVVHNLRRSVTSIRGKRPTAYDYDENLELEHDERRGLVRSGSSVRSDSSVGSDVRRSATVATSRPRPEHRPL